MYKYFIFTIFLIGCSSEPESAAVSNNLNAVEELQKAAMKQYMESPVLALPMMEKLAKVYSQESKYKQASETYLNIATIHDQTLNKKEKAVIFGQRSFENAVLAKDEKQLADVLTYLGYIKGLTGKTKEAKKDIVNAITKYKALSDESSVASAHFNLARVFYMEGGLDESAHFLAKSLSHFRATKDANNIFTNNLFSISLFRKMNIQEKVQEAIDENKALIPSINYTGYAKQEFERLLKEGK